jgi:uncharacterized protein (TIGR03790 family)
MGLNQSPKFNVGELFGLWCILAGLLFWVASTGLSSNRVATLAAQSIPLSERVLVVYNQSSSQSLEVANYYMTRRGIPASNKCAVNSAQTTYIGDWNAFDSAIKTPIRNCLNAVGRDKILYIVFSYQTPFKVGSPVRSLDQQIADIWDEYSASNNERGRHAYFAEAQSQGNVYQPFISLADYRQQPASQHLYSVWRLDAASVGLAKGLVDKALLAETGGLSGRGCFDLRGNFDGFNDYGYGSGDWDIHRSAELARAAGFPVTEDFNYEEFGTQPAPLRCDETALYAGWYSLDYYNDAFTWKPGAIGLHTDSLSAYDVRGGTNWSANALIKGITVTSGAIEEPELEGIAHPDGVFRNLFEGANVGDALLRNTEYLKWMIVNIGDPLYRPFPGGRAPFNSTNTAQPSLSLKPLTVGGGGPSLATLTLPAPAQAGGAQVTLASSNTSVATVPSSITVPAGATSASFNISTSHVTDELFAKITASYPGGAISSTLIVRPNHAPTVSLTTPSEGQTFTAPASIIVSAAASDIDGQINRVDFYAGATLIGTDSTSPYSITWNNVATGNYKLMVSAIDSAGAANSSVFVNIRVSLAPTPTPTPTPVNPPVLLTEEGSNRALAFDSVSWVRDPYSVWTLQNFSPDQQTRVMLFAVNLELQSGEISSAVTAQAEDSTQNVYPLVVEYVGKVPLLDWLSQVIVKLPVGIANAGDVQVSINLHGTRSNSVIVRLKP